MSRRRATPKNILHLHDPDKLSASQPASQPPLPHGRSNEGLKWGTPARLSRSITEQTYVPLADVDWKEEKIVRVCTNATYEQ